LPAELEARQHWAGEYSERLADDFIVPNVPSGARSAWAQYTIRPREGDREVYRQKLADRGVPSAIYYGRPLHLQPAFADLGGHEGQCPVAERCAASVFSLPMDPYLRREGVDAVADALLK
jgi:dTDP-4-amino-4,6-dideoxygalactose transaminase